MIIHYVKVNPSGNITLFILDPIAPEDRKRVNDFLLTKEKDAEQCACLGMDGNTPKVEMLGGEFCGNASRSSAAYALYKQGGDSGDFQVRCSGCEGTLEAHVEKKGDNQFEASIQLPLPLATKTIPISYNRDSVRCHYISMSGIDHYVYFTLNLKNLDQKQFLYSLQREISRGPEPSAYGLMLVELGSLKMIPVVYVTSTGTLYWENSCGSGSAAVAVAMAQRQDHSIEAVLKEPGGTISVKAEYKNHAVTALSIGGPVSFGPVQQCEM